MSAAMPGMPDQLAHDWHQLTDLIDATAERQDVPCRTAAAQGSHSWTAADHREQAAAALVCARCPVLIACRRYGIDHPREAGVYGGLTRSERVALSGRGARS